MAQTSVDDILGPEGALSRALPGFATRESQQRMAALVEAALREKKQLLVEAGTGTGKTFAYLVPAMLSRKKLIISTGTKNLQDQLYFRDLPLLRQVLEMGVRTSLLKGRANYLCKHRLEVSLDDGRWSSRQLVADLHRIERWAAHTTFGDISEVRDVAEDSAIWPSVTSTTDNCLGQDCPDYEECFLVKARKQAQEADVVVVNHHLFFADAAIKEEGFGELLPDAEAVIFDEAHQLPDVAALFFGESISARQLNELTEDAVTEMLVSAGDMRDLRVLADRLDKSVADMRLAFGEVPQKAHWRQIETQIAEAATLVSQHLLELAQWLGTAAARSKGLAQCHERAQALHELWKQMTATAPPEQVHWFETFKRGFVIGWTPLDVSRPFSGLMSQRQCAWIFTSATLAIAEDFRHFAIQLGLNDYTAEVFPSPFDYERQALFYLPRYLPDPADSSHTLAMLQAALPILESSRGRAFILFTSHRALKEAADWLPEHIDWPLMVQGSKPKAALLEDFRAAGNAVLLGTGSFWEGVDVRGEALSCVIIDRLPFASPGDPVVAARIEAFKSMKKNAFFIYQMPEAIIALKQGAGRLIRDIQDVGVFVVCDSRLVTKPYGKQFLSALPPMRRTRDLGIVQQFFQQIEMRSNETVGA